MGLTRDKFYNVFWQNQACQNTFLLSKNELLDSVSLNLTDSPFSYPTNRIIISNSDKSESKDVIKLRTESYDFDLESSIDEKILYFEPLIISFLRSQYGKQFDQLIEDIRKRPIRLAPFIIDLFSSETDKKQLTIDLLQQYHFIPPNIDSFEKLQKHLEVMFTPAKKGALINEWNIKVFSDGLKFVKELYVNHNYKRLYNSNQILVNALVDSDNFTDRVEMFHRLYDAKILLPSSDDGIAECHSCDPLTYRGSIQLRLNPKKLQNLTCPSCEKALTYFVPYVLNQEIFEIVQSQDGLLNDAAIHILEKQKIPFSINEKRLNDIEIDCKFILGETDYLIETKMYELKIGYRKLRNKIKGHFADLADNIIRLKVTKEFKNNAVIPILLVNITDENFLNSIEKTLKSNNQDAISQSISILNIKQFRELINRNR